MDCKFLCGKNVCLNPETNNCEECQQEETNLYKYFYRECEQCL